MDIEEVDKKIADAFQIGEFWVVGGRDGFAFRYGPFQREEVGPLMERAITEGVAVTFVITRGRDVDWRLLKELTLGEYQGLPDGATE